MGLIADLRGWFRRPWDGCEERAFVQTLIDDHAKHCPYKSQEKP